MVGGVWLGRINGLCASPLHNPKETDSGEAHWPFGETWDTWSRGKSRWLPINITNESTLQDLHSCKAQPKIVDLHKKVCYEMKNNYFQILLEQTNNNN